jgi:WhiB family redox-sensing transcriptional regulator
MEVTVPTSSAPASLRAALARPSWFKFGRCRGSDTAWFFEPEYEESAKRLCAHCPVRSACLAYALANPELDGVWAGTTPAFRDELRSRRVAIDRRRLHVAS